MEGLRANSHTYPAFRALLHRGASHLYGLVKPWPEIYRRFTRELGASPGEILFFDDREENVIAARAEGWRAERIDAARRMRRARNCSSRSIKRRRPVGKRGSRVSSIISTQPSAAARRSARTTR